MNNIKELMTKQTDDFLYYYDTTIANLENNLIFYKNKKQDIQVLEYIFDKFINDYDIDLYLGKLYKFDKTTFHHSISTATYAIYFALKLVPFDIKYLQNIFYSAILHDIGKLYIPKSILDKKGKLTNEEFDIIKNHPQFSLDIISMKNFKYNDNVIDGIYQHHERLDGSGYPNGLKNINPFVQIISFADVLDALSSTRPYRNKLSYEEIVELFNGKVSCYNNDCINLYKKYFNKNNSQYN